MNATMGTGLRRGALTIALALAPDLALVEAWGQAAPSAPPPPPAAVSPAAPVPAAPVTPVPTTRPTLIPEPGDPVNVDEVVLQAKSVLILSGTSGWDDGLKNLRAAFARMEADLSKLGLAPRGRPLAVFTQTTDDNFSFEAMIPIDAAPSPAPALSTEMRFGSTPSGKAFRFVHKGPYDDIDSTYETITTYLEAKDLVAKDVFFEEFVNDVADPAGTDLEVNIYVQPK